MSKPDELTEEDVEICLQENLRDGYFEQLVGENGETRWRLTEKGRLRVEELVLDGHPKPPRKKARR